MSRLTAREMWEWYIKPGMERARKLEQAKNGDEEIPPMSDEAICGMLEMLGVLKPARGDDGK